MRNEKSTIPQAMSKETNALLVEVQRVFDARDKQLDALLKKLEKIKDPKEKAAALSAFRNICWDNE